MVRSDKWKKRTITDSYWAFKSELKLKANIAGLKTLPQEIQSICFIVPMPNSWSEKKKKAFEGMPHTQRPDLDNFLKGVQDCLCSEDSHIWRICYLSKVWGRYGQLIIEIND
jgi:Holliday junction resolvase RusA-like endonuclease